MSDGLRIRPMESGDLDAVVALAASLESPPHWPRSAYVTAIDPNATPRRIALAAEMDGVLAGFVIVLLIPPEAELETIAVIAGQQRKGIARTLLFALLDELQSRSVTGLALEVRASNLAAQALYRAVGFQDAGRRPGYYAEPAEDAVLMYLPISQNRNNSQFRNI